MKANIALFLLFSYCWIYYALQVFLPKPQWIDYALLAWFLIFAAEQAIAIIRKLESPSKSPRA